MNHCGICGGGVRLFSDVRYGRPITDWKHTDAPPGTEPHRPILGRPVDTETLDRIHRPPKEEPVIVEPITYETSPIRPEKLPAQALQLAALAGEHNWGLLKCLSTKISTGKQVVGLAMVRHDIGFTASWASEGASWKFQEAFLVDTSRGVRERVGSNVLKEWIRSPLRICETCGRSNRATDHEECA